MDLLLGLLIFYGIYKLFTRNRKPKRKIPLRKVPGLSSDLLWPMLATYMFINKGAAHGMDEAMHLLQQTDRATLESNMNQMLSDQDFMAQMQNQAFLQQLMDQQFLQAHQDFAQWGLDETMKGGLPFEQGGYDMEWGNSFNDVSSGGLHDHHHHDSFM